MESKVILMSVQKTAVFNNTLHISYFNNKILTKYFNNVQYLHNQDIPNETKIDLNKQNNSDL